MARTVYRKVALDKLSSPEELDRLMRITSPGSWLLLGAVGAALLVAVIWGVFGQIATTMERSGILTRSSPVQFITAPQAGQVVEIKAKPGALVLAEEVVARLKTDAGEITVTSAGSARIVSVRVTIGDPVDAGTPLFSIESFDRSAGAQAAQPQEIVIHIPLEDRQRLRPGLEALVLPSTVEREKYGYIKGEIASVAEFAATREEILTVLSDANYVDGLLRGGPLFEVRVSLRTRDDGSFVWSASKGPPTAIVTGTPCQVIVNVDQERPISKVFNLAG
jgi:multidrug efflux pump subunit AcrA (membrane-fusion protein)